MVGLLQRKRLKNANGQNNINRLGGSRWCAVIHDMVMAWLLQFDDGLRNHWT